MSVQLIVYPQITSSFSLPTEVVSNGNNFVNVGNNTSTYPAPYSTLSQQAITALSPLTYPNTWYGYYTPTTSGAPSSPTDAVLLAGEGCGILQNLTNLTAGLVYNLEITVDITGISYVPINIDIFNGAVLDTAIVMTPTSDVTTVQFTAPNSSMTALAVTNINASYNDFIIITNISVMAAPTADGQVILDLYEDEDLPLTLSVEDFKNVAENVASYSKAFNLPATKRNNKAFDNIFEITRDYQGLIFNPYQKTECLLKQNGFLLFKGYLRLLDVTDKLGEISYNVNLYSEVVAFADTLKDRTFSDLGFTELEHDYDITQIERSNYNGVTAGQTTPITFLNPSTSGFRTNFNTVKYPFIDWNRQWVVANGSTPATSGFPELTSLGQAFRPCINIKYLVDRIFQASDFTYTSDFFNTAEFSELFMDFNWGEGNAPVEVGGNNFDTYYFYNLGDGSAANYATNSFSLMHLSYNIPLVAGVTPPNYNDSTNILTSTVINESYDLNYDYIIENTDTVNRSIECRWLYNSTPINYSGIQTIAAGGTFTYSGNFSQIMFNVGDTLQVQFKTDSGTASKVRQSQNAFPTAGASVIWLVGIDAVTSNTLLQTLRGELGQWEFLKGLITMFNLVTLPNEDNPNNIIIEPYGDVFISTGSGTTLADRGIQHDWTDKIDISEMKLTPLADLNKKTMFKFVEDDDDYSFNQYKNQVGGHLYGSQEWDAWNEFNILEGTEEIEASPFAATVVKSLDPQWANFVTPAIYARGGDGVWEGFDNSPRIFYNRGLFGNVSYYVPAQNGVAGQQASTYGYFSHLRFSIQNADARDLNFGIQQLLTNVQGGTVNNLFQLYWLPYYSQLYNPNTRVMTIKVNLNASDINLFKFNDKVFLKNRVFRVNKIDYKPNDLSTVEFILIT